jgi:hypothetical protein
MTEWLPWGVSRSALFEAVVQKSQTQLNIGARMGYAAHTLPRVVY